MSLTIEGIFPAHITPFLDNEEIDANALHSLVRFWLDSGCTGLVSCASNGEGPNMTREERRRVLELVIEEVNGKALVVAGTGSTSTRETIFLSRDAMDVGADAALIVAPYYFKPDSRELFEHYSAVIRSTEIPVILYNAPKFTGYNLDPEVIVRLAEEYDQVVGVKDSGGSIGQISGLIHRLGARISVLAGTADLLLPSLLMGGKGGVVAVANVAPGLCVELWNQFRRHQIERARQIQMKLLRLDSILVKKFDQISAIKEAMNQQGLPAGHPRRPSLPLEEKARNQVKDALALLAID